MSRAAAPVLLAISLLAPARASARPEHPAAADAQSVPGPKPPLKPAPPRGPVKSEAQASGANPFVFVPAVPPRAHAGADTSRPEPARSAQQRAVQKGAKARSNEDIDYAPLPGAFRPEPAAIPSPFAKTQIIDHRGNPDLEVGVSDRTTLGVFSDAGTIERTDIRNSTVRPTRDLGAGVTLQYKFGQ